MTGDSAGNEYKREIFSAADNFLNYTRDQAIRIQATRHSLKIHCVSSCRSSRWRSSGRCSRT